MRACYPYLLVILLSIICYEGQSQVIADHLPGCMPDPTFVGVACGAGAHEFGISGGQIVAQNVDGSACTCFGPGGPSDGYFEYPPLDISAFEDIMISFEYTASDGGTSGFENDSPAAPIFGCQNNTIDNSHDQIVFMYSLDGGPEVQSLYVRGTTMADFTGTWVEGPLNGDMLTIKVYAANKATAEIFYFSDLVISGTPASLDAGPPQTICNDASVTLGASGSGSWTTTGSGIIVDPSDPNTDYNPAPSDNNSTVSFTYTGNPAAPGCYINNLPTDNVDITFTGPTATLAYQDPSFTGDFCSGDCQSLDVNISGGTPLYELQMSLSVGPVNLPSFPVPGFAVGETITICYDEAAFLPDYDNSTRTITVPGLANGFSGTVNLIQITDANGCSLALSESVTASFQTTPELDPAFLNECPDPSGFTTFILSEADIQVDPGGLYAISYFEFNDMTGPLNAGGHVVTGSETVYAFATEGACTSDPAPVSLTLLPDGNVGPVEFYCDVPTESTSCLDICDFDGSGNELVDLTVTLTSGVAGASYELEYEAFPGGRTTLAFVGPTVTFQVLVSGYTSVEILSITELGLCADVTDLGGFIELNILTRPQIDFIPDVQVCSGSYELPPVPGTDLSSDASYYTLSGGQGTEVPAGTIFTGDTSVYAYDGVAGCDDEAFFLITIGDSTTYDVLADVTTCGVYTLPPITGANVGSTATYYTGPGGTGISFSPGESLTASIPTLYIYDATSSCQTNEPSFSLSIAAADTLQSIADTIVCDVLQLSPILSSGALSGDEAYYTAAGGMGDRIAVDSFLLRDSVVARYDTSSIVLYAYDSLSGCRSETSFRVTFVERRFAGRDTTLSYCSVLGERINLVTLVGIPDTGGIWSSSTTMLDVVDPTDVSLAQLSLGRSTATYTISDSICGDASAKVTIDIEPGVFAGLSDAFTFCENEPATDLYLLMAAIDQSGTFSTVPPGIGFDFSVPQLATFSGLTASEFDILYIVQGSSAECPADTAILDITVTTAPDAGRDSTINVCQGSTVDLSSLVTGVSGGDFAEVAPGSGLTLPSSVNTTGLSGDYAYLYITSSTCGVDTAVFTITVSTSADAGDGGPREACDIDQPLDLTTLLSNADGGGQFYIDGGVVPTTVVPSDYVAPSIISYIVGDGVSCDFDTAIFVVTFISADFDLTSSSQAICPDRAQFVFIDYLVDRGYTIYLSTTNVSSGAVTRFTRATEEDENRMTFQVFNDPDGVENGRNLEPDQLYIVSLDSVITDDGSCTIYFNESVPIRTASVFRFELDTTLCMGDSVLFLNRHWQESFYDSLQTTDGCDSIIDIRIDFLRQDTMMVDGQRCEGFSLDVDGTIFDESNASGEVLLTNELGCDSLIIVDLTFSAETIVEVMDTICDGGQIVVSGEVFDSARPTGMVRSTGVGGDCDTLFDVALTIVQEINTLIDDVLCEGGSIMVGTEVFDIGNPIGTVMLSAVSGCDSIVEVDLTFDTQTVIPVTDAICPGDTLFVNGNPYYLANPSGNESVPGLNGDCDTLYQIALQEALATTSTLDIFSCNPDSVIVLGSLVLTSSEPMGSYVAGLNSVGCDSIVEVMVTYGGIGLAVDVTTVGTSSQLALSYPGPYDYIEWTPSDGLSCTDCPDPIAAPAVTTEYFVFVEANGCIDSAQVTVRVESSIVLDFPSVISPDGSAGNEVFYVKAPAEDSIVVATMIIYDRWGNQVFSVANVPSGEPAFGWDGSYRGRRAAAGVYVYYLELSSAIDPQYRLATYGDITVLR